MELASEFSISRLKTKELFQMSSQKTGWLFCWEYAHILITSDQLLCGLPDFIHFIFLRSLAENWTHSFTQQYIRGGTRSCGVCILHVWNDFMVSNALPFFQFSSESLQQFNCLLPASNQIQTVRKYWILTFKYERFKCLRNVLFLEGKDKKYR